MQYSLVTWHYAFPEEWEQALFEQRLADIGFEAFDGEKAYIQTSLLDLSALQEVAQSTPHVTLLSCETCPDENWNQTWEEEHSEFTIALPGKQLLIRPHCAFGAGYHETTSMMVDLLVSQFALRPFGCVLDNGCGTGILGIAAALLGAREVIAVDIDEHSVTNTLENALANHVELTVLCGDTPPEGSYDLIMSNIHRNILLHQMPLYARSLTLGGELWISGFYESDCPALIAQAEQVGLKVKQQYEKGEWRLLQLYRPLTA